MTANAKAAHEVGYKRPRYLVKDSPRTSDKVRFDYDVQIFGDGITLGKLNDGGDGCVTLHYAMRLPEYSSLLPPSRRLNIHTSDTELEVDDHTFDQMIFAAAQMQAILLRCQVLAEQTFVTDGNPILHQEVLMFAVDDPRSFCDAADTEAMPECDNCDWPMVENDEFFYIFDCWRDNTRLYESELLGRKLDELYRYSAKETKQQPEGTKHLGKLRQTSSNFL